MLRLAGIATLAFLFLAPGFLRAEDSISTPPILNNLDLDCVYDGIEDAVGSRPSAKYLLLLGYAVQQNTKNADIKNNKETFQRNVIERVQAYGFCVDKKVDNNGTATEKTGYGGVRLNERPIADYIKVLVSGCTIKQNGYETGCLKTPQVEEVVRYFGFTNRKHIDNMLSPNDWSSLDPVERQRRFTKYSGGKTFTSESDSMTVNADIFQADEKGDGLKECFNQIKQMQKSDTPFNLTTKEGRTENQKFCEVVANKCSLSGNSFCAQNTNKPRSSGTSGGNKDSLFKMKVKTGTN